MERLGQDDLTGLSDLKADGKIRRNVLVIHDGSMKEINETKKQETFTHSSPSKSTTEESMVLVANCIWILTSTASKAKSHQSLRKCFSTNSGVFEPAP